MAAYVSIRQHTSAYVSIRFEGIGNYDRHEPELLVCMARKILVHEALNA